MAKNGYYPVYSCKRGKGYFLRSYSETGVLEFKQVIFWEYRPHPAEITVKDGEMIRLAYRVDLFQQKAELE